MTYRCKSCGSNATASLSCDYCGAGTTRTTRKKQPGIPYSQFSEGRLIVAASLLGLILALLAFIADNMPGGAQ